VKTDTPQGRNLRQALQNAVEAGINTRVKIRHGDIIHEIKADSWNSELRGLKRAWNVDLRMLVEKPASVGSEGQSATRGSKLLGRQPG
jgi:hypothetical protein